MERENASKRFLAKGTLEDRPTDQKSVSVVINFLSQVIYIFLLFQLHLHTLPYPKTKEKQKVTGDEKLTTTYPPT